MPLYIGDYLRDTMRLSLYEHGAYLLLLMAAWTEGGSLKMGDLMAYLKVTHEEWEVLRPKLEPFFEVKNGCWIHGRVQREVERSAQLYEKKVEGGKRGAEARWKGHGTPNGTPIKTPNGSSMVTTTTTTTTRNKVKVKSYCANFDLFWNSYPKKTAKAKAAKSYEKAISAGVSHERLIEAVEKAKRMNTSWHDPQYIPMAATWLNGRRWEDEFTPAPAKAHASPAPSLINEILTAAHEGIKRGNWKGFHPAGVRALKAVGGRQRAENLKTSDLATWQAQFRRAVEAELAQEASNA
tara:strand:- start:321 stop:1205 length:885 start_codon:yes stop_codon:yes gene_type:complete